ncbi:porin family protein [Tenuifilum thalassicum]|uniref:PorT family protein n=1 Tax=Tenuifilum thalassicum TaxID=2590900 RepID=A0A7D4BCN6_9BACT|nr:porin family protein [Tenuifilum thalassicum]QKG78738.1 PorT family protein [Tenuifilum thalassicum]
MNRKILTILFSTLISTCFAQTYFGVKGGYTMSDISFNPVQNTRMLFADGFDYGLVFKYYNLKYFGFQAELYRVNRGYRQPIDIAELGDTLYKRVNSYIELPIFMQVCFQLKRTSILVNAGPYIAYMIKASEGNNSSGQYVMKNIDINILRDNRIDFGLIGGVGVSYDFNWGTLYADGRIGFGFGDMQNHTYGGMPKQSKARFQSINIGYLFRFGNSIQ